MPRIPMVSLSQADRQQGQIIAPDLRQFFLLLSEWELEKRFAALFGDLSTHVHNTTHARFARFSPVFRLRSQEAHQWNCRFSQVRIFLCNQASNE